MDGGICSNPAHVDIVAGTPPGISLVDPTQIKGALRVGYERSKLEAQKIKEFWA